MRIGLMGVTKNDSISNDHHFRILFNNDPLGSKDTAYGMGSVFSSMKVISFQLTGSKIRTE
jgi:hypothetical protein